MMQDGLSPCPRDDGDIPQSPLCRQRLKVVTYNIHNGVGTDGRYDLDRIARALDAEQPDIVALQEVDKRLWRSNYDDQTGELADALGLHCLHCTTWRQSGGAFGISVLSRFPIVASRQFDLTHARSSEPRSCMRVDCEVAPGALLHIFNCHLGLATRERQYQQRQMLSEAILLSRDLEHPVLLLGDFNDRPFQVVHQRLRLYFKDAFRAAGHRYGPTFRLGPFRLRLDRIYTSPEIHVVDSWVRRDGAARGASDHRPLVALVEVEWRPQPFKPLGRPTQPALVRSALGQLAPAAQSLDGVAT